MKIAILSTDTKHHTYFINKLSERFDIEAVVYEKRRLEKDYPTGPFFDKEQDDFEERFFDKSFGGTRRSLSAGLVKRLKEVYSVNQEETIEFLEALKPDAAVTFGVGIVGPDVFSIPRFGTINVHRGIIQSYRGLDSDLWAIYEDKFDRIGVTAHYVDKGLDTGQVLKQQHVKLCPEDEIYHLRYKTTVVATGLVSSTLEDMQRRDKKIIGEEQRTKAPYYSAMPLEKKYKALENFREYREGLKYAKK